MVCGQALSATLTDPIYLPPRVSFPFEVVQHRLELAALERSAVEAVELALGEDASQAGGSDHGPDGKTGGKRQEMDEAIVTRAGMRNARAMRCFLVLSLFCGRDHDHGR